MSSSGPATHFGVRQKRHGASAAGFTIIELLVSVSILLMITLSVVGNINRSQYQEELNGSARLLAAALRDLQTRAYSASSVKTCDGAGGVTYVCEQSTAGCVSSCASPIPPYSYGMTIIGSATSVHRFAEVEPSFNNRREQSIGGDQHEQIGDLLFLQHAQTANYVTLRVPISLDTGSVGSVTVTFERQNGTMRINGCGTPAPYTPGCAGPEPTTARLQLQHARIPGIIRTVYLNAITGRVSLE